jgi:protein-S-isoprenylcysteine O-methyltransferase Ste14
MTTQLNAINWAKIITILVIVGLILIFGISGQRQALYACMHISYCAWWLLEQKIYPERRKQIFTEKVGIPGFISALLIVGIFYSLPAFLAFTNPANLSIAAIATAIPLFYFGSLINTAADIQKTTEKASGVGLVRTGIWSEVRHINYTGDLMRYLSFSVVAGSVWAFLVPLSIFALYLQRIREKEVSMRIKYKNFSEYESTSFRLIPGVW